MDERTVGVTRRRTVLWSGLGDGGRCGARRTFAVVPRATSIRPRSNRKMLETPPLSTAAKPAFDPVARCGVPPGARALEATTIAATAAIARPAATPATARRSTRRERIAGVLPEPSIDVLVDRRRLERALDCSRMLAPEVLRTRWGRVQAGWRVRGWVARPGWVEARRGSVGSRPGSVARPGSPAVRPSGGAWLEDRTAPAPRGVRASRAAGVPPCPAIEPLALLSRFADLPSTR